MCYLVTTLASRPGNNRIDPRDGRVVSITFVPVPEEHEHRIREEQVTCVELERKRAWFRQWYLLTDVNTAARFASDSALPRWKSIAQGVQKRIQGPLPRLPRAKADRVVSFIALHGSDEW